MKEDNYMAVKLVEINIFPLPRKVIFCFDSTIQHKAQISV